ncbi:ABC transporter transmembrane domain-containing protein [Pseudonocardia broussonetiae]|uniref:ABC transporter ATP-binding protein n=1 Tax=Pseudonocardia broussonetiae TaxID=2736640 RepID=A0A6M6JJC5_9PSEU|nr:ABC transporter ATP-binding protein [Pseudonocardia broussonetiae]QJY47285.1 ABC transporter ATP-binding protein [Pseudonocardia broussonetiae]
MPPPSAGPVLRSAAGGQRRHLAVSSLLVAGHQLSEAAVPVVVGAVIDLAVSTGDAGALLLWSAVVAGVFVVLATSAYYGYWLEVLAGKRAAHAVRMDVTARVLHPGGGAPGRPGELVSLAGSDADRTGEVAYALVTAVAALAALAGGAVVLLSSSVLLGLVVLGGVPVVLVASRLLARPLVGRAEAEQETLAAATGVATDLVTGLRVVKGIGAEDAAAQTYRRASRSALTARLAAARAEGVYTGATGVLTGVFLVLVAWVGGRLALAGTISVGELVAGVGLAQFLIGPLERLTAVGPQLAGARGAARRVAALLAAPPAVTAGHALLPADPPGAVDVRDVAVAAGEHLGVVTLAAADAAALLDVLARDVDGPVALDGTDLRGVDLDDARRVLLVARHDAVLFEGTVRATIGTDPAALAAAGADEVLDALPGGLDAELGERGRTLSGGQRQRLALARALTADPPVLVLHDPTTAVDAATEDRIADGLARLRAGRTTVVLTSSPALLARCHRVLLVADGAVVASGTHADLVDDERYRTAVLS